MRSGNSAREPSETARRKSRSVLIVLPWSPGHPGGVSVVVRYLLRHLDGYPLEPIAVVSDWGAGKPRVDADGVRAFRFAIVGRADPSGYLKAAATAPLRLLRTLSLIRETRADAVNFHYPGLDALGVALLRRLRLFRGRIVLSFHGTDVRWPSAGVEERLWRVALSEADAISACSNDLADRIAQSFGLHRERIAVVYNGVDPRIFAPAARGGRLRAQLPERYVASVGSYIPRKGHRLLLGAFARIAAEFPDTSLVIAGMQGPERERLLELAARSGLSDRLVCHVDLSHEDTASLVAGALVCVQAAHAEPFGLAVIEAGACGVPVAASAVSGHTELLRDRETGFLFAPGDEAGCAAVVREMLREPDVAGRAARRFRDEVLQRFGWDDCARAYFALIDGDAGGSLAGPRSEPRRVSAGRVPAGARSDAPRGD